MCPRRYRGDNARRAIDQKDEADDHPPRPSPDHVADRLPVPLSPPVVLYLSNDGHVLAALAYDQPGDGSDYVPDVKRMFPRSLASYVLSHPDGISPSKAAIRAEARSAFYG